ncbi:MULTISPECIES: hypothetical protein [Brevibacterium]|uniref:Uncharacterized protein n=3 Tax=Brevibacterium casei TaxID=33889 RepID=K9ACT9_9MICO|nr:hypothetical protein [Brevibacterium casei]NJE67458.1 hypothetical protein [Brevibacterium sp. LS14]SIH99985.1 Uncharacterised protein [Mycobacteroides abscessus subsp. abscessus]EKU45149.1 hypothetical protein C272_15772 [Brevibacterium casei S18]KZE14603.1 hypothetical protein AVW13_15495 [Brevibacterium casei]MBE4694206.1 hypothetical protein [Brevibacterium casei]
MIEWSSFAIVAIATWFSSLVVIGLFSTAVRMRAVHIDQVAEGHGNPLLKAGYWAVFALCGALVLFGVYLIVPVLHGA